MIVMSYFIYENNWGLTFIMMKVLSMYLSYMLILKLTLTLLLKIYNDDITLY